MNRVGFRDALLHAGWANGEHTNEEDAAIRQGYRARLSEIEPRLPVAMLRLRDKTSLHDALIESVHWSPARAELPVSLVCEKVDTGYQTIPLTYHGALLGKRRVTSMRNAAQNKEACILR